VSNQQFINNQIKTHPTSTGAKGIPNGLSNSMNEKRGPQTQKNGQAGQGGVFNFASLNQQDFYRQ